MLRKTNIPFKTGVTLHKDVIGLADTITGFYRVDGTADAWTPMSEAFAEDKPGAYLSPLTITTPAIYELWFESTDTRIGTQYGKVVVANANIDDVKVAIEAAQGDITAIKAVTDLLNTTELENLSEGINANKIVLEELMLVLNSADAADSVTSIRELLTEIQSGGVNVDSLINGQGNIEAMLKGDEFLADGTTVNPLFGNGLDEIYAKVETVLTDVSDLITAAKTSIETAITDAKTSIESKIAEVKTVVDGNASILGNVTFGNEAIRNALDALSNKTTDNTNSITSILNDAANGLAAIKTAVMDKLAIMDGKLDTILDNQTASTAIQVHA